MKLVRSVRVERLTISLPEDLAATVREAVEIQHFASVSELVRDALREWLLTAGIPRATRKPPPAAEHPKRSDITEMQAYDLEVMGSVRRLSRFAVRGSTQKRVVEAAATFPVNPRYHSSPEDARENLQIYLSSAWRTQVKVRMLDSVEDPTEWLVIYDADLPGSETDSSSTS